IPEANKNNNEISRTIVITSPDVDLVPTSLTAPDSGVNGKQIAVSFGVENQGSETAQGRYGYWYDYLYLSDAPDGSSNLGGMNSFYQGSTVPGGSAYSNGGTVSLPTVSHTGTYYLALKTDSNNDVAERSEGNNVITRPITITAPDLVPIAVAAQDAAALGRTIPFTWTVQNRGDGDAIPSWYDALFLSTSPNLSGSKWHLGNVYQNSLVPVGASYTKTQNVTIPSVTPGPYYLVARADQYYQQCYYWGYYDCPSSYVPESNENNNLLARPITITASDIDLHPIGLQGPA
ncbi:MAG: hypothetical protein M1337_04890, partial [Actinobacteria bacterium]|nr:hypothetical protein [Actinomycetota bacterium]